MIFSENRFTLFRIMARNSIHIGYGRCVKGRLPALSRCRTGELQVFSRDFAVVAGQNAARTILVFCQSFPSTTAKPLIN
jgi:hypothetical protein